VLSNATPNRAAAKNLETQRGGLFVSLERWIDRALKLAQEIETKDYSQEGRPGGDKRP
jgi:hypothetical protein